MIPDLLADHMWMSSAEAATRLGVKRSTVYAYASRGLIRKMRGHNRLSRFRRDDVERLAARGRRGSLAQHRAFIETSISSISGDRLSYRGLDAVALSKTRNFEQVALWLWTGRIQPSQDIRRWVRPEHWCPLPDPASQLPLDKMIASLALLPMDDPVPTGTGNVSLSLSKLGPAQNTEEVGAAIISFLVESMGHSLQPAISGQVGENLLCREPSAELIRLLDAALILASEHGLATPTVSARIVASVRGDLRLGTIAGLCAMRGAKPGAAALKAESLFAELHSDGPDGVRASIPELLRESAGELPGLGHPAYQARDPRATELLLRLRHSGLDAYRLEIVEAVQQEITRAQHFVNLDFALGALSYAAQMRRGAAEALFCIGRTAGWIAHMIEELASENSFRISGIYTGPEPSEDTE